MSLFFPLRVFCFLFYTITPSHPGECRIALHWRIERPLSFFMILQARLCFLTRKGIHVGLSALVERGPSQGARSESTGPTWMSFLHFIVRVQRAKRTVCLLPRIILRPRVTRAQGIQQFFGLVSLPVPMVTSILATPFTLAQRSPNPGVTNRNGPPFDSGNGAPSSS